MSPSTGRAALMCASIVLVAFSSPPASAELPKHPGVVTLSPTPAGRFGIAVAIRNGIAFVGLPGARPMPIVAVYGQTATSWVRTGTLTVSDAPAPGFSTNRFGRAIAFRDGVALIASDTFLHVFRRSNGVWKDVQKLAPPPLGGVAQQIWSISAMRYENGILAVVNNNVVYIYGLDANGKFVRRATLNRPATDVGVAGNTIVVGSINAAYVFRRRSDGRWFETQKLTASDIDVNDRFSDEFGAAVAIDRGMIIVGAPGQECFDAAGIFYCPDGAGAAGAGGAAYVFVPIDGDGQYVQFSKLRPSPDEHSRYFRFGSGIAMFDKHIVIRANNQGSVGDPVVLGVPIGLAFTYRREGWTVTARGITKGYADADSMGLANNWLLVSSTFEFSEDCIFDRNCRGEAIIFDLNRFAQ